MALAEVASGVTPPGKATSLPGCPPGDYDVLLLDAGSRQSLASARSLGRAGLRVALGECFAECDPSLPVLAFRSRYSNRNVILPSFAVDAAAFAAAVVQFVRDHHPRIVLPASDGAVSALMPVRERLQALGCQLALPTNAVLEIANRKDRTLDVARNLGIDHPKTVQIKSVVDVPAVLSEFKFPLVIKPAISWVRGSTRRLQAVEVVNETEAVP